MFSFLPQRGEQQPYRTFKKVSTLIILLLVCTLSTRTLDATRNSSNSFSEKPKVSAKADLVIQSDFIRVAVVKACVGDAFERISRASLENGLNYSKSHGYDFFIVNEETFPETTFFSPPAWVKVAYLRDLLVSKRSFHWFFWLDCDTLILRPEVPFESVLQEMNVTDDHDLAFTEDDPNNQGIAPFNSGMFLLRNSVWAKDELSRVLRLAAKAEIRNHGLWEQEALRRLYVANENSEHLKILIASKRWKFNAFDRLQEETNETFIWHRTACRVQPKCDDMYLLRASQVQF